jgi:hypothetical protein
MMAMGEYLMAGYLQLPARAAGAGARQTSHSTHTEHIRPDLAEANQLLAPLCKPGPY